MNQQTTTRKKREYSKSTIVTSRLLSDKIYVTTALRIADFNALENLAKKLNCTRSEIVRNAIRKYING